MTETQTICSNVDLVKASVIHKQHSVASPRRRAAVKCWTGLSVCIV